MHTYTASSERTQIEGARAQSSALLYLLFLLGSFKGTQQFLLQAFFSGPLSFEFGLRLRNYEAKDRLRTCRTGPSSPGLNPG